MSSASETPSRSVSRVLLPSHWPERVSPTRVGLTPEKVVFAPSPLTQPAMSTMTWVGALAKAQILPDNPTVKTRLRATTAPRGNTTDPGRIGKTSVYKEVNLSQSSMPLSVGVATTL